MIYCPKCGTANRQGSRFCNECGTPLPATGLRCPMCGAMNPAGNIYCDRCSARLIPAEKVSPEEEKPERPSPPKGISLPSVPLTEEEWLSKLRAEAEAPGLLPEEEVPEWLAGLEAPAAPTAPEAPLPEAAIPEWLRELEAPARPPAPEAPLPEAAIPEWLRELEKTVPEAPSPAEKPTPPLAGIPAPLSGEMPDWLRNVEFAPPIQEELSAQPPPVVAVDVHAGVPPAAPTTVPPILIQEEEELLVTTPGEIPEWLKEAPEEAPPEFGGLVPAEIPEWLRALQPREEATVEEEPAETEGFLVGLRGLLPIGKGLDMPATAQPPLPRAPSPAAVARAELLQGLLSRPMITPPTAETREAPRKSGWLLTRFLVGVILLAAILLPMMVRLPIFGLPTAPTAEALFSTVNQLPGNIPVLIAWEYGPAESDEMDRVAGPLIEHLLRREARLIVVSTRMEGPAAAEALLTSRLADPSERSQRIANLGYLPGQAAGVREALGNLDGRTEAITGSPASQLEAMADVHSIADVGMVVVLAAQPDDLKTWVEQVSAANPNVPVVAGVSARTELISTPYLTAGQLRGMVAGLTGGAVYERQLDTGRGREYEYYLTSLGMAQMAVAALTVIGALIFLVGGRKR